MIVFADSSALVKLYLDEAGHDVVRSLSHLAVSELARVEVVSGLSKKVRVGDLTHLEAGVLADEFAADFYGTIDGGPRFAVVRTSPGILDAAAGLVAVHRLRAYDAIQLATALALRSVDASLTSLCVFDRRLATAAAAEGLSVVGG